MAYPFPTVDATPESSPDQQAPAQAPDRPAALPDASEWNADAGKWEVSGKDGKGVRDGECLLYRPDGTLFSRARFVAGVQDGPFFVYHRNGDVAREGRYVAGRVDGTVTAYTSDDPEGERLRVCCVPPGAVRLQERYRAGEFLVEAFYDRQGRAILSDGRLCPLRPAGLPELAQYDESRGGWTLRSRELDRYWSENGTLTEEIVRGADGARVVRRFDRDGAPQEEVGFAADDRLDGPFWRRFPASEPSPYADARIRQERGVYEGGQQIGAWELLDAEGRTVRTVDRGVAFRGDADPASPLAAGARADWPARAQALVSEGRVREALVAAARGAAAAPDRAALLRFVEEHTGVLTPDRAAHWGEALSQATDATIESVLDALVCGADPAACFRALAAVLPGIQPASAELIEASLLLAPDRRMTHLTRALLRFQRGDREGADADADVVAGESIEAADSLRSYGEIVFRRFDDWPSRETLAPDPELDGVSLEPAHELDDIRHVIGVYASRLVRARDAMRALLANGTAMSATTGATPAWLPADLSGLLPAGPVVLRRETVECDPDPDAEADAGAAEPPQPDIIQIDEQLETGGVGVPALLAVAHADWAALSWLCWAVGLDRVALPDAVTARPEMARAMKLFVQRSWRIKDRLGSGSLIARSKGIPGFEWQGVDIDALPRHLAEMAAAEYIAVRSMFIWLASSDAVSPFQDDIRDA